MRRYERTTRCVCVCVWIFTMLLQSFAQPTKVFATPPV